MDRSISLTSFEWRLYYIVFYKKAQENCQKVKTAIKGKIFVNMTVKNLKKTCDVVFVESRMAK